ncbi:MAG: hypothetical protein Q8N28_01345 [bacterium]|nr:hypothetical protein [bacterium]
MTKNYKSTYALVRRLMHFAQAMTRLPEDDLVFCKFGYFLFFGVGL